MSLKTCINRAVQAGLMDKTRAKFAKELFDKKFDNTDGGPKGLAEARMAVIEEIEAINAQLKREKLLQINAIKRLDSILKNADNIPRAAEAVLAYDPGVTGIANVEKRIDSIRGQLHAGMTEMLYKHRRDLLGRNRDKAGLRDILAELHGENTGNASAREIASAWREVAERARLMFNEAGGAIGKRGDWALPQSHNAIAIRAAGFDAWYRVIEPLLNRKRMVNHITGKQLSDLELEEAARAAFEQITTEGWAGRTVGAIGGKKLAHRHLDHRIFVLKNSDAWAQYHEAFGEGDVFSAMIGHIDMMAREIALMQILGPNPAASLRWLMDSAEQKLRIKAAREGARTDAPESKIKSTRRNLQLMYDYHINTTNAPINGKLARTFAGGRSILQSAQLGSAAISAVFGDIGFQRMAAKTVGLQHRKIVKRSFSLLDPTNAEDQKLAVRLGLIADHWSTLALAQHRFLGEVSGPEITRRLADFTMRVSALSPWTQAGRWAFGMEFSGLLADNAGKHYNALSDPLQRTLERYGISEADWDIARATPLMEHKGASFLRPDDIADKQTALKFLDMLHTETEYAVPNTSTRGRIALIGESRPGTAQGEIMRSFAMFKNFAVTLMFTHYRRALSMPDTYSRVRYGTQLFLTMTAMGALALQMKELSKGRDPRPMNDLRFLGASVLQGGGLGIFGDFLFASKSRYDQGLEATIAGPVFGFIGDVTGYLNENVSNAIRGKDTKFASGAIDLAQRYSPTASIWYSRAILENMIFDELQKMVDPATETRLRRMEKKRLREYNQDYWWKRSNDEMRAPDFSNVMGN